MKSKIRVFAEDHASEILTGVGVTSMVSSTVLAVKATPKVVMLMEDAKDELETEELKPLEVLKIVWKPYLPSAITGIFGIGCIITACGVNAKKSAALAAACSLSENALRTYAAKTLEVVGEEKEKEIREVIGKAKVQENPITPSESQVLMIGDGETLCYDGISGRYFKGDLEKLRQAENDLNRQLIDDSFASLNDYYYYIGLEQVKIGDVIGWNYEDGKIEFIFSSTLSQEGKPCLVVEPALHPEHSYKESYR